jgi:hypothetical protein
MTSWNNTVKNPIKKQESNEYFDEERQVLLLYKKLSANAEFL